MRHVILSPHFDDAVYSCGGSLHQWVETGDEVNVITIMGGGLPHPLPDSPIIHDLHARWQAGDDPIATRQAEDQQAIAGLGAHLEQLNVRDCIYRTMAGVALYPTEASLWADIQPNDPALTELQGYADNSPLNDFLKRTETILYAPLGVGQHVDHRIVRRWAHQLSQRYPAFTLRFYTDYPYMRDKAKIQQARADLTQEFHVPLTSTWVRLSDANLSAKIHAMSVYRSQISSFWADETAMIADVQANFMDEDGHYAEQFWTITR